MYEPNSAIMPRFARTSGADRRMPRRTSGLAVVRSIATKAISSEAAIANATMVSGAPHPCAGASTMVRTRSSMPAVSVTAPGMSNEQRAVVDDAADRGGNGEDGERDEEHAAAAEQVGRPAAEQEEAAVAEDVARDDPLQLRRGQPEVRLDRRQCHADHGDVEPVQEEHAAQDRHEAPDGRVPLRGGGGRGGEEHCDRVHALA